MKYKILLFLGIVFIVAMGNVYANDNITNLDIEGLQDESACCDVESVEGIGLQDESACCDVESVEGVGLQDESTYHDDEDIEDLDIDFPREISRDFYCVYGAEDDVPTLIVRNVEDYDKLKIFLDGEDVTDQTYWSIYGGIPVNSLTHGLHTLEVKYIGNKVISKKIDFKVFNVAFEIPEKIVLNDGERYLVTYSKGVSGKFKIYIDGKLHDSWTAQKNSFYQVIEFYGLSKGNHRINLKYYGNEKYSKFNRIYNVNIDHSDKYTILKASNSAMIYSNYKISLVNKDGQPVSKKVGIYIKDKLVKTIKTNKNGVASFKVNFKPGSEFVISFDNWDIVKKLKIKHILSFKKVNVKKSSKKLVLKASLKKVNGKYLKNKKITFKFNGKKYIGTTNSKGIAKVIIKKSLLKKLNVGKTVKYQVKYHKDIIKKSSKVKN